MNVFDLKRTRTQVNSSFNMYSSIMSNRQMQQIPAAAPVAVVARPQQSVQVNNVVKPAVVASVPAKPSKITGFKIQNNNNATPKPNAVSSLSIGASSVSGFKIVNH